MSNHPAPIVSIIVPVYNVEAYLDCCLASIISQTYEHLEIIIVEDCSTDASLNQLQPHLSDPRVRLIQHDKNYGLSASRNTGIEAATGKYILFVDSDDAIASPLVETCVAHAETSDACAIVFDFKTFQDGAPLPAFDVGSTEGKAFRLQGAEYFRLPHFAWLKFIRADLLRNPYLRFPAGLYYEDWPFHWKLGFLADPIWTLQGKWYFYRLREKSITAMSDRRLLDQFKVQSILLHILRDRNRKEEIYEMSEKVHMAFWVVLTRIQEKYLAEALSDSKKLRAELDTISTGTPRGPRAKIIGPILSLPLPVALFLIKLIRYAKNLREISVRANANRRDQT